MATAFHNHHLSHLHDQQQQQHHHHHHHLITSSPGETSSFVNFDTFIPASSSASGSPAEGFYCGDCRVMFESSKSLEVHLSYHKENLLSRWASQDSSGLGINTIVSTGPGSASSGIHSSSSVSSLSSVGSAGITSTTSPSPVDTTGATYLTHHEQFGGMERSQYLPPPPMMSEHHHHGGVYTSPMPQYHVSLAPPPHHPPPPHHHLMYEPNSDHGKYDPPAPPPPPQQGGPERENAILDLDSHKVHVYNPHGQGDTRGFFHRPYLPPLLPPAGSNGWGEPWMSEQQQQQHAPPYGVPPPPPHHHPGNGYPLQHQQGPLSDAGRGGGGSHGEGDNGYEQNSRPPPHGVQPFAGGPPPPQMGNGPPQHGSPNGYPGPQPGGPPGYGNGPSNGSDSGGRSPGGMRSPAMGTPKMGQDSPAVATPTQKTKGWKGGECKRPKNYNCQACNKWFTSSGHLKRHYGTTLHKNSVRQKGEPVEDIPPPKAKKANTNSTPNGKSGSRPSAGDPSPAVPPPPSSAPSPQMKRERPSTPPQQQMDPRPKSNGGPYGGPPNGGPPQQAPHPASSPNNVPPPPFSSPSPYNGGFGSNNFLPPHPHHLHPPVPFSSSYNHEGMPNPYNSVPSPSVPTTLYGGYSATPGGDSNGSAAAPLPPFSSVAFSHYDSQAYTPAPNGLSPYPTSPNSHQQNRAGHFLGVSAAGSPLPNPPPQPHPSGATNGSYNTTDEVDVNNIKVELKGEPPAYDEANAINNMHSASTPEELRTEYQGQQHLMYPGDASLDGFDARSNGSGSSPQRPESICSTSTLSTASNMSNSSQTENNNRPIKKAVRKARGAKKGPGEQNGATATPPETPSEGGVLKCPDCTKTFLRACYLTQHTNSSHAGGKPFRCTQCGKRFPEAPALKDHVAKHGSDKPYKCELCPKQFNHKTDLRRHLCLHTGEKPFNCHICGKGFIRKDHMTKHTEIHTKKKGAAQATSA